ncbi:MAG: monovalent cation/H(+) antiporter subunit G [Firmicutes bacterium]|nr:monovalent cation/H(+) antiporter subunit G [Bacillota bacterium]
MSLAYILFFIGVLFFALTSFGLMRMPDAYCRIHAVSLGDTLGLLCITLGLLFLMDGIANLVKLVMVLIIMWIVNPTISHYVSKVALLRGNWIVVEESELDREVSGL